MRSGLGLIKEAQANAAYSANYPGSRWYQDAYTRDRQRYAIVTSKGFRPDG